MPDLELEALPAFILVQHRFVRESKANLRLPALQHGEAFFPERFREEFLPDAHVAEPNAFEAPAALASEAEAQGIPVLPQHADILQQQSAAAE